MMFHIFNCTSQRGGGKYVLHALFLKDFNLCVYMKWWSMCVSTHTICVPNPSDVWLSTSKTKEKGGEEWAEDEWCG